MDATARLFRRLDWWFGMGALAGLYALARSALVPSFSVGEALWIWCALTGLRFGAENLYVALGDRAWHREHGINGSRQLIARMAVRREAIRLSTLVALLTLGIYTATPPAVRPGLTWVPPVALIWVCGAQTINSLLDTQERRRLLHLLRQDDTLARLRDAVAGEGATP